SRFSCWRSCWFSSSRRFLPPPKIPPRPPLRDGGPVTGALTAPPAGGAGYVAAIDGACGPGVVRGGTTGAPSSSTHHSQPSGAAGRRGSGTQPAGGIHPGGGGGQPGGGLNRYLDTAHLHDHVPRANLVAASLPKPSLVLSVASARSVSRQCRSGRP